MYCILVTLNVINDDDDETKVKIFPSIDIYSVSV